MSRAALVGTRLPDGRHTIEPDAHRRWVQATYGEPWASPFAHPVYLFLVAHCGMGISLTAFFELIGTRLEDGVMFGQGDLEQRRPLRVGGSYRVATEIAAVERKQGAALGPFDLVTCRLEVGDEAGVAGVSLESYVVPLREPAP